ncbi:MAG: glycosyltransferase family 1 protein [Magnetococcales bacterium]|nr:glycosyltransferase family 1 protein [Magnetococcales bacterium]
MSESTIDQERGLTPIVEACVLRGQQLLRQGDKVPAMRELLEAVRLQPKNVEILQAVAQALRACGDHQSAFKLLVTALGLSPLVPGIHQSLADICRTVSPSTNEHKLRFHLICLDLLQGGDSHQHGESPARVEDTFFVDSSRARQIARRSSTYKLFLHWDVRQICYHSGDRLADDPETLFSVPIDQILDFFLTHPLRLPTAVDFDKRDPDQIVKAFKICSLLDFVPRKKNDESIRLVNKILTTAPVFTEEIPLRVYFQASRFTTVMQYSSKFLAKAFSRQGCQVFLQIDENDLQVLTSLDVLRERERFKPHVVFDINHLNNKYIHDDTFHVSWWQDPMDAIRSGQQLPWRPRDLALSILPAYDEYLRKSGARHIFRQEFCVDLELFRSVIPLAERRKIVFVGSHILETIDGGKPPSPFLRGVIAEMREHFLQEKSLDREYCLALAKKKDLDFMKVYDNLGVGIVREVCLEWLCAMASELDWQVEIHGRHWEKNPLIASYFHGELAHGEAVARVYNQARYALSVTTHAIRTQRLAECAACGCIPVVFDERHVVPKPHWENELLYFRTEEELRACFDRRPSGDPQAIAQECSYDAVARFVLDWIRNYLVAQPC